MVATPLLLLTLVVASLHGLPICPSVSPGDMANFFPNEDGKYLFSVYNTPDYYLSRLW
jgi:hypothetical protein